MRAVIRPSPRLHLNVVLIDEREDSLRTVIVMLLDMLVSFRYSHDELHIPRTRI